MDQHEYVRGAIAYYNENYYEPGNPEDGVWEDCHYPEPECLGGTTTIKLLKQHHAVQGVLQSEEYQHRCIWGWEVDYLSGDLLNIARKWMSQSVVDSWDKLDPQQRKDKMRNMRIENCYLDVAFEHLPAPVYWGSNPSAPKPVLIHYRNGEQYYTESIKQASRIVNVSQSTIQRRLQLSLFEQFNRSWMN
jgi:hypothetical protein